MKTFYRCILFVYKFTTFLIVKKEKKTIELANIFFEFLL